MKEAHQPNIIKNLDSLSLESCSIESETPINTSKSGKGKFTKSKEMVLKDFKKYAGSKKSLYHALSYFGKCI